MADKNSQIQDAQNAEHDTDAQVDVMSLIEELTKNPDKVDELTEEELASVEKKINPYGCLVDADERYSVISFTNYREKFMERLMMTSMVSFMRQLVNEWEVDVDDLDAPLNKEEYTRTERNPDKDNKTLMDNLFEQAVNSIKMEMLEASEAEELTEDEEIEVHRKATDRVNELTKDRVVFDTNAFVSAQELLIAEQSSREKKIIQRWMNHFFKFDPLNHVRSAFDKEKAKDDPERGTPPAYPFDLEMPGDVFSQFSSFYEVNYDDLRKATQYFFCEKPDLEVAINVYDSFDTIEECNDFILKNKSKVITDIHTVTNNKWTLVGPFSQNRKRMDFYNKNTKLLENMMQQREDDAKLGRELLSKRITKKKVKNVKQYGKDHPNFLKYKKQNLDGVYDTDITKIDVEDDKVTVERELEITSTGSKVDADGVPEDAIEIGVTAIDLKTNKVSRSKIYTEAVDDTKSST